MIRWNRFVRAENAARGARSTAIAIACAAVIAMAPLSASASTAGTTARDAGLGFSSFLLSLVYSPVKVVYATGGLVVGGLAYTFSGGDSEVAKVVLTPSLRGDYLVTSNHLSGQDELQFFGRDDSGVASSTDVAAAPEPQDPAASENEDWGGGW